MIFYNTFTKIWVLKYKRRLTRQGQILEKFVLKFFSKIVDASNFHIGCRNLSRKILISLKIKTSETSKSHVLHKMCSFQLRPIRCTKNQEHPHMHTPSKEKIEPDSDITQC